MDEWVWVNKWINEGENEWINEGKNECKVVVVVVVQLLSGVWLLFDPMGCPWHFSRQENWSGLAFPSPRDLPDPGIEPIALALRVGSLLLTSQVGLPSIKTEGQGLLCWSTCSDSKLPNSSTGLIPGRETDPTSQMVRPKKKKKIRIPKYKKILKILRDKVKLFGLDSQFLTFFFFWQTLSLWGLSSLTRDWTRATAVKAES